MQPGGRLVSAARVSMVSVHTETLPRHIKELVVLSELYRHILYGGEAVRARRKHDWDDSGFGTCYNQLSRSWHCACDLCCGCAGCVLLISVCCLLLACKHVRII